MKPKTKAKPIAKKPAAKKAAKKVVAAPPKKKLAEVLADAKAAAARRSAVTALKGFRSSDIKAKLVRHDLDEATTTAIRRKLKTVLAHFRQQGLLGHNDEWVADLDEAYYEELDDTTMTTAITEFVFLSFTDRNDNEVYIEATGLKQMRIIYEGHHSTSKFAVRATAEELAEDFQAAKKLVRTFTHRD